MSGNLKIVSLAFLVIIVLVVLSFLRKDKISAKYAVIWLLTTLILLLFVVFPNLLNKVTTLLGFNLGANMIITGLIVLLICINIALTIIVSSQSKKIELLIQEVSILKKNIEKSRN